MTRIIRGTLYPSPDPKYAITQVIRQEDLQGDLPTALKALSAPVAGALIVIETFDMAEGTSVLHATLEAKRRMDARSTRDMNMAMLYHWDGDFLARCNETGVLSGTVPAPHLTEDDVCSVLSQLFYHPNYKHQTVFAIAESGSMFQMKDGVVTPVRR